MSKVAHGLVLLLLYTLSLAHQPVNTHLYCNGEESFVGILTIYADYFLDSEYKVWGYTKNLLLVKMIFEFYEKSHTAITFSLPEYAELISAEPNQVKYLKKGDNTITITIPEDVSLAKITFCKTIYGQAFFFRHKCWLQNLDNPISYYFLSLCNDLGKHFEINKVLRVHIPNNAQLAYGYPQHKFGYWYGFSYISNTTYRIEGNTIIYTRCEDLTLWYEPQMLFPIGVATQSIVLVGTIFVYLKVVRRDRFLIFEKSEIFHKLLTLLRKYNVAIILIALTFLMALVLSYVSLILPTKMVYIGLGVSILAFVYAISYLLAKILLDNEILTSKKVGPFVKFVLAFSIPLLGILTHIIIGNISGIPAAAHGVSPYSFGAKTTILSYLGFGGGNIPRLVLAALAYVTALYVAAKTAKKFDVILVFFLIYLLFFVYFLPIIGVFEADLLSSFVGGEPAPISNKIDSDFSAFIGSFYQVFAQAIGVEFLYSRGIVLYGIGIAMLLSLPVIKSSTKFRTLVALIGLPLFARGIMRIGDLDVAKFVMSFSLGSVIGFICCIPPILVMEFLLRRLSLMQKLN